jgi:sugar/nucleoside kinase (ribokinase family)
MGQWTYDIAFIGHFTKDTIIRPGSTTVNMGGAWNFGCHAAAATGLRALAATRLAREDMAVVEQARRRGVDVQAILTPFSTCLRLIYPGDNPDQRTVEITSSAGPFTVGDVEAAASQARTFLIGASVRGEVPLEVVRRLAHGGGRVSIDLQGYLRVNRDGLLVHEAWPDAGDFLGVATYVKADIVEAADLTGETGPQAAARALADFGPREVVITSREGITVLAEGRFHQQPWRARRLDGRSGRGDTCMASYVGKRLSSSPAQATLWAAALTSLKLEQPGPFMGSAADVQKVIAERYIEEGRR